MGNSKMTAIRTVAAAAALLLGSTKIPALADQTPGSDRTPENHLQQGEMSDAMVHKVGLVVRHMASVRQQYAQRVQSAESQQQRQTLIEQAQSDMLKVISDQGLSVDQYNQAIQRAKTDPQLKERILSAAQSDK
jgi:hypothetical protein